MADILRYEYAPIGLEYLEAGDISAAKSSLDALVENIKVSITDPRTKADIEQILQEGTEASKEGIAKALSNAGKRYMEEVKDATLGDFWAGYQEGFLDGEKKVYNAKISSFAGLKPDAIQTEIKTRAERLKDIMDNNTAVGDAEIRTLNEELSRYQEALSLILSAQDIRTKSLRAKVYADAREADIKDTKKKMRGIVGI